MGGGSGSSRRPLDQAEVTVPEILRISMAAVPPSTACASEDPRATLRSDFQPGLAPREQRHPANARSLPHTNLPTARCGAFWDVCRSEEVKAVAYRSGDNQFIFSSDIIPLYALHFPHGGHPVSGFHRHVS